MLDFQELFTPQNQLRTCAEIAVAAAASLGE